MLTRLAPVFHWWSEHPWHVFLISGCLGPLALVTLPLALEVEKVDSFLHWPWIAVIYASFVQGLRVTWRRSRAMAAIVALAAAGIPVVLSLDRPSVRAFLLPPLLFVVVPVLADYWGVPWVRRRRGLPEEPAGTLVDATPSGSPAVALGMAAGLVWSLMSIRGMTARHPAGDALFLFGPPWLWAFAFGFLGGAGAWKAGEAVALRVRRRRGRERSGGP